jgi:hypothetical protein
MPVSSILFVFFLFLAEPGEKYHLGIVADAIMMRLEFVVGKGRQFRKQFPQPETENGSGHLITFRSRISRSFLLRNTLTV